MPVDSEKMNAPMTEAEATLLKLKQSEAVNLLREQGYSTHVGLIDEDVNSLGEGCFSIVVWVNLRQSGI